MVQNNEQYKTYMFGNNQEIRLLRLHEPLLKAGNSLQKLLEHLTLLSIPAFEKYALAQR
jgi:hypothetical protein